MMGKNYLKDQPADGRVVLGQVDIVVELHASLVRFTAPEEADAQAFKKHLLQYINELLGDLALPVEASLLVLAAEDRNVPAILPFHVYIGARKCFFPLPANIDQDVTPLELARTVAQVILQNRELCLPISLSEKIRQQWLAENNGTNLDAHEFHKFLSLFVQYAFSIDKGKIAVLTLKTEGDVWAETLFEATVSDISTITITAFLNEAQYFLAGSLPDQLHQMRDSLFEERGIIIPKVKVDKDQSLAENELRLLFNDLRYLPCNLKNTDTAESKSNLPSWALKNTDMDKLVISKISSELRNNAAIFLTGDCVKFLLQKLTSPEQPSPLRESTLAHFEVTKLTHILRNLLAEDISIRDLRSILEALISINGILPVDQNKYVAFAPATANLCPVINDRKIENLDSSDYVNYVRITLKRYLSYKYTGGSNDLSVLLLSPGIETRIREADKQPLTDKEHEQLIEAILNSPGRSQPSEGEQVILTRFDIRKRLRDLIERSFPQLVVLCQQELLPDVKIQSSGQISWT